MPDAGAVGDGSAGTDDGSDPVADAAAQGEDAAIPAPDLVCDGLPVWDRAWADEEAEMLTLVNEARSVGRDCDGEGYGYDFHPPAGALDMDHRLRCAARSLARYMGETGFLVPCNEIGCFVDVIRAYGYEPSDYAGMLNDAPDAATALAGWLDGTGEHVAPFDCDSIMKRTFVDFGAGLSHDHVWHLAFGRPL